MKKWLVGLTGSIASGKSTALTDLAACGAYTISADELVRELYQTAPVQRQLMRWFSTTDTDEISRVVFTAPRKRKQLEDFLHPLVWQRAQEKLAATPALWAVFEVPLLFESGWDKRMDVTVLITAGLRTQAARLKARGLSQKQYQARRQAQLGEEEKIKRADIVVYNDGTTTDLEIKMKRLYQAFSTLYV